MPPKCSKKDEKAGLGCCPKGKSKARNGGAISACKRKPPAKKATKKDRQGVPVPAVSYGRQFVIPVIYQQLRNQQVANFQRDTRDASTYISQPTYRDAGTMVRLDEITPASPVLPLRELPTPLKQSYEEMSAEIDVQTDIARATLRKERRAKQQRERRARQREKELEQVPEIEPAEYDDSS